MWTTSWRFPGERYAEFDDLQRQFERLFGLASGSATSIRSVARGTFPAMNVGTTADAVEVYAFAPGIDASTLEVSVDKGLLTIAGERKDPLADERTAAGSNGDGAKQTVYARERTHGSFRRVIALPEDADPQRVEAGYRNGVLKIRIDKREASRPRRIQVGDQH